MSTSPAALKYLFIALYDDGSRYEQTADDRSILHTGNDEWWPSAFRDVDLEKLRRFRLIGEGHTYTMDMKSGNIFLDGACVFESPDQEVKKKLIYYRRMAVDNGGENAGVPRVEGYVIGWETTEGEKHKVEYHIDG